MPLLPKSRRGDLILAATLGLLSLLLYYLPTGFEDRLPRDTHLARARVISIDDTNIERALIVKTGMQRLEVEILEGPLAKSTTVAVNLLTGKMELDEIYTPGETILVEYSYKDGRLGWVNTRGTYRIGIELALFGLFAVLLLVVAGWTGFNALVSFVFTALMLWKVMVPLFLKGHDPILVALGVVAILITVISFLVGGLGRKGLVSCVGSLLGLLLTYVLAVLFTRGFQVHGAVRPFSETLLYSGFYHLDLTRIFIAGIFTASAGAVMDLATDISASLYELHSRNPDTSRRELIRSGLAVGRTVIGPMTTTLLLAYSGSFVTMFMLFMGQGIPMGNIFNLNLVAAEVLNTCVGSFGLVTVAPLTALAGGFIYSWRGKPVPAGREFSKDEIVEVFDAEPAAGH